MADYQLLDDNGLVLHASTGRMIPPDPLNRHHRAYLTWVAAGGVPDPAPEPPEPTEQEEIRARALAKIAAADILTEEEAASLDGAP